jgi:hypothetical protein
MKRFVLALVLALGLASPAFPQGVGPQTLLCNKAFQVSQGATALTKVVSNVPSQQISLCGWALNAGAAAATAQLEYGTGTNCATGTTAITPAISLGVNGTYVDHSTYVNQSVPQLADLCLVTTGTGPMQVTIYYSIN